MIRFALASGLALCLVLSFACKVDSSDDGTPASGLWVCGYYVAYDPVRDLLRPEEIDWSTLTHFVMAALQARADGSLALDFYWDATRGPALAKDLALRAHAAGKKAVLMLGGAGQGSAIRAAATLHRADFVRNLINAMNDLGYDGLDLDWEDDIDWSALETLVSELRTAAPSAILTMPVGPINPNFQSVDSQVVTLAAHLDRINIMSYYPATAMSGGGWLSWHNSALTGWKFNTPVTIEDSLGRYAGAGIPKAKLGMGVSFYAIGYTGGITAPNQPTDAAGIAIQGGDNDLPLSKFYGAGGIYAAAHRQWDSQALVPYLSLPAADPEYGCRYFSFEDEESIAEKGAFAKQNGYGGIVIWNLNQGYVRSGSDPNFLMKAMKKAFLDD